MVTIPTITEIFTITEKNPLLSGHVVYGRSLLPGVGYVDLVLQVLARHGHPMPEVELCDITIFAPLVAGPGEQILTTVEGYPTPEEGWRIEVRSRRKQDANDRDVLHAVVTACRRPSSAFQKKLDLPLTQVMEFTPLTDIYSWCRQHELVHSGLMKIEGGVHRRSNDWIGELKLSPQFHSSTSAFLFHPALFEAGLLGGGIAVGMLFGGDDGPGLYLPLMLESFRAIAPLGTGCFVRVPVESVHRDHELVRLRVEFYDGEGTQIAEIGQFVGKRVRAPTSLDVRGESRAPASPDSTVAERPFANLDEVSLGAGHDVPDVLRNLVATRLDVPPEDVDLNTGYYELGLASADLLHVVTALGQKLSLSLSPTIMFEYRTIAELAAMLESKYSESLSSRKIVSGSIKDVRSSFASTTSESIVSPKPPEPELPVAKPVGLPAARSPGIGSVDLLAEIRRALIDDVSALLNVAATEVDSNIELRNFGFDWTNFAQLAGRLDERYGVALESSMFLEHRTVEAIAEHLFRSYREEIESLYDSRAESKDLSNGLHRRDSERQVLQSSLDKDTGSHPMLGRQFNDGDGVGFETVFSGNELYLQDHKIHGAKVLPGAAHLELARAAVVATMGSNYVGRLELSDVVWLRPAIHGPNELTLRTIVRKVSHGGLEFDIYGGNEQSNTQVLHSQGRVKILGDDSGTLPLNRLRAECADPIVSAVDIYARFTKMGLDYGPGHRPLSELRIGKDINGDTQVLAELRLPPEAQHLAQCQMNPSMLDGALQAVTGLHLSSIPMDPQSMGLALPFAVEQMKIFTAIPAKAYVWVRRDSRSKFRTKSAILDISIADEHGQVCVELHGVSMRTVPSPGDRPRPSLNESASSTRVDRPSDLRPAYASDDIAIIGVSGRYPEAADLNEFWHNLCVGRDCIREIPSERWDRHRYAKANGVATGKWGGFLEDIDLFDPLFFQISMLEAEHLDPQERIFLECAHHVLEDAGYTSDRLSARSKVGVFVAVMYQEYQLLGAQAQERGQDIALWGSASTIANRVSYFFDFQGPSMAVDTMCSSSLTSIHLACESIRSGQCDAALAGGVNLSPHPNKYMVLSQRQFLSSDGRCRSFGDGGDGYVPSEGVGAVVLKSVLRAIADGDHIYGVIKGSALNHGGRASGYSVPTPVAQGAVIVDALKAANVDVRSLSYIEAHGTGTSLGDPIEIDGLNKAFREVGQSPSKCALGSVKSNIGHCESAAGIAAVTKVLLQMKHEQLVPSLHSSTLNPYVNFDQSPLHVQQVLEPWSRPTMEIDGEVLTFPRIAGVSSFGGGGSNAHVIISEYIAEKRRKHPVFSDSRPALFVLSAMSERQLVEQARRLCVRLKELNDYDLFDVAWTLQTGRMALEERLAFAATSLESACSQLELFVATPQSAGTWVRGTVQARSKAPHLDIGQAKSDWSERGTCNRLLDAWSRGAAVEWNLMYSSGVSLFRISLPGYPFARERCWPDLGTTKSSREQPILSSMNTVTAEVSSEHHESVTDDEVMLFRPRWVGQDTAAGGVSSRGGPWSEHYIIVVSKFTPHERDEFRQALPQEVFTKFIDIRNVALDEQYYETVAGAFSVVREILAHGDSHASVLLQVVVADGSDASIPQQKIACLGGVAGFLKSANMESPRLHTQCLDCLDGASPREIVTRLFSEAKHDLVPEVRYRNGRRLIVKFEELAAPATPAAAWKEGGVYLVTGGLGALGRIVVTDISASVERATVILVGRSALGSAQKGEIEKLRRPGLALVYRRADVSDRAAVAHLIADTVDDHGTLHGIVHSAGVIDDGFIIRKSIDQIDPVLSPKVRGLVNLDEMSQELSLDIFLCFSSTTGTFGNSGQADYAAANAFMDAYAAYRNFLVDAGVRSGSTVSIAWPLWDEGGMGSSPALRDYLLSSQNIALLDTKSGIEALHVASAGQKNKLESGRMIVIAGKRHLVIPRLMAGEHVGRHESTTASKALRSSSLSRESEGASADEKAPELLEKKAAKYFRLLVARALKIDPQRINDDTPLERYGLDSVVAVNLTGRLEDSFGSLPRTLLLEIQTIGEIASYFVKEHSDALRNLVADSTQLPRPNSSSYASRDKQMASNEDNIDALTNANRRSNPEVSPSVEGDALDGRNVGRAESSSIQDWAVNYFRRLIAGALKLSPERLNPDTPLERYGMDSVLAVNLTGRLEESFGSLPRTLLLEIQTIRELVDYFVSGHEPTLRNFIGETRIYRDSQPDRKSADLVATVPEQSSRTAKQHARRVDSEHQTQNNAHSVGASQAGAIAIVGISGRYPQADDLGQFWSNLRQGKDCITTVPDSRWSRDVAEYRSEKENSSASRTWLGSFLDQVDHFDPLFFGVSPRDAAVMDPQQRLFLETAWHVLEDGGVTQKVLDQRYQRRVGVYVGASTQTYRADESDSVIDAFTSVASYNMIANRVSQFFGLEGPSLAVDSMCTASTMAIHLACVDLQRGETELAIAGGVNLLLHPVRYIALSEMDLLGSHPGSRSYCKGDGYIPSEGVGAVLLKSLDAAIRDGDTIHAVIRGTASMHGGRANGFMTPSHRARVRVMRRALEVAKVDVRSIGYVEDSADGSMITDEVGIGALREVFKEVSEPVPVGTVKSILGHPEAVSGIAQLTKVVLQMQHQEIVPLAKDGIPNPNLNFENTPLNLCRELRGWEPRGGSIGGIRELPRRALINSVAAGGSHVSLVIEAPPPSPIATSRTLDQQPQVVVLSAKTPGGLCMSVRRLHDFLENTQDIDLGDVAYTSQVGREMLSERLAFVATSLEDLRRALANCVAADFESSYSRETSGAYYGNVEDGGGPLIAALHGARGEALISGLIEDGEWERLAELWVHGIEVPWWKVHKDPRQLVQLPVTAFETKSYWIGKKSVNQATDRSAEPVLDHGFGSRKQNDSSHAKGFSAAEQMMAALWADLLQVEVESLRKTSDFFALGGNSLSARRLINLVHEQVGVELSVNTIFNAPRLSEAAIELERHLPMAMSSDSIDLGLIMECVDLIQEMSEKDLMAVVRGAVTV